MSTRSVRLAPLALIIVAALFRMASADMPDPSDPDAHAIFDRVQQLYAGARSYQDDGDTRITYTLSDGTTRSTMKTFSTAFERPGRFRYLGQGDRLQRNERYVIWRDGAQVGHWSSRRPVFKTDDSFNDAVTIAVQPAVFDRASYTVASLLMPTEVWGYGLDTMTDFKRLNDATLDGDLCFRIEGEAGDVDNIVWVAQSSHLIRRIEERSHASTIEIERITTYHPVIDAAVDGKKLELPAYVAK